MRNTPYRIYMEEVFKIYKETYSTRFGHRIYEVSNFGRGKINGAIVELKDKGYCYNGFAGEYMHRIVAQLFVPNPDNKPEVDHIDGNRRNNCANNLRWVTRKENLNNPIARERCSKSSKGKKKSASHIKNMSKPRTDEHKQHISDGLKGHDVTDKARHNMHLVQKDRKYMNNGIIEKRVKICMCEQLLKEGYTYGRLKRS